MGGALSAAARPGGRRLLQGRMAARIATRCRTAKRCASMAPATTRSRRTAATTPFTSWSASIPTGDMYLLDLWRKQASSDEWIEAFCDLVMQWKPIGWAEETGQIRAGVGPFLERRQRERQAWVYRESLSDARRQGGARAINPRPHGAGWALRSAHAPWYPALRSELLSFPAGKHDDQVDALGLVGQFLDRMTAGREPIVVKPKLIPPPGYILLPGLPEPQRGSRIRI